MNLGLSVLAFDCVYNRATTEDKAMYWKTSDDIVRIIIEESSRFEEVACAMKEAGKRLYSWKTSLVSVEFCEALWPAFCLGIYFLPEKQITRFVAPQRVSRVTILSMFKFSCFLMFRRQKLPFSSGNIIPWAQSKVKVHFSGLRR